VPPINGASAAEAEDHGAGSTRLATDRGPGRNYLVLPKGVEPLSGDERYNLPEQLVTHAEDLRSCCEYLAGCRRFGLDTEFVGEDTFHPHLCLVQVGTVDRLILIDPLSAGPLDAFWKLVTDPTIEVVVHAGREEVRLCRLWTGRTPGNLFDLQLAAGITGLAYPLGHAALVSQLLRIKLAKAETLTEWRNRPLTRAQLRYAFDDVRYLLPLRDQLAKRLEELRRLPWLKEECERLAVLAVPEDTGVERWRKLKGLGSLDRRRLAVVRALYAWREETATRTNRPTRAICRDDLLIEIARRNPVRERDLQVIRGLPQRDLAAIVDVVEHARALPLEHCPALADREQDPPQVQWLTNILTAVLGDMCVRKRIAANLVACANDVKLLVRAHCQGNAPPGDALLAQGWRREHVLPTLLATLEGRQRLRVRDARAETPFAFDEVPPDEGVIGTG
jgi:ribonuclease D